MEKRWYFLLKASVKGILQLLSQLIELAKPAYPDPHIDTSRLWVDCPRHEDTERELKFRQADELEMLYAKEFKRFLQESQVIAAFHTNLNYTHYPKIRVCPNSVFLVIWWHHSFLVVLFFQVSFFSGKKLYYESPFNFKFCIILF